MSSDTVQADPRRVVMIPKCASGEGGSVRDSYSTGWSGEIDLERLARLQQAVPVDPPYQGADVEVVAAPCAGKDGQVIAWESRLPARATYFPPARRHVITVCLVDMPDVVWCYHGQAHAGRWQAGDVMIRRAGNAMFCHTETDGRFLHLAVAQQELQSACAEWVMPGSVVTLRDGFGLNDATLSSLIRALGTEQRSARPLPCSVIDSVVRAVCVYLHHSHLDVVASPKGLSDHELQIVTQHLREHMAWSCSLASVARELGMSPSCLARRFKQRTGDSLGQYAMGLRLRQAHALLRSTRHTVTEVAMATGFADLPHFSRHFRKRFGMPPSTLLCR